MEEIKHLSASLGTPFSRGISIFPRENENLFRKWGYQTSPKSDFFVSMHCNPFLFNAYSYHPKFVCMQQETIFLRVVPHCIDIYTV
jgi:hypothetical protein